MLKVQAEERPTKAFYRKFKSKHARQHVNELYNVEDWSAPSENKEHTSTTTDGILSNATRFYKYLFRRRPSKQAERLLSLLRKRTFTQAQAKCMDKDISIEEVRTAMRSMANSKSPGPDGIPSEFYKVFEELVCAELHQCAARGSHRRAATQLVSGR